MLFDSITLLQGATIQNAAIATGSSFPTDEDLGELFFNTSDNKLYVYDGSAWVEVGSGSGSSSTGASLPASGTAGELFFNTTDSKLYVYDGSAWVEVGSGGTVNSNVGTYGSASAIPTLTVNEKGQVTAVSETTVSITPSQISTAIPVAKGGTGATTATAAINALVPAQSGNAGKYLTTNGSTVSWQLQSAGSVTSVDLSGGATGLTATGGPITTSGILTLGGVLGIASGGTGQTTAAGAISALLPNQAPHGGKFLQTDGGTPRWAAISGANVTSALGYTPVNKAGDTMTGTLVLSQDPVSDLQAATKRYVDNVAAGINVLGACRTATTAPLTATYTNGTAGVNAKLTGSTALPVIGGVTLTTGQRVLVKNQNAQLQNGIYVVTSIANPWIFTRATDYDGHVPGAIDAGDTVFVQEGDLAGTLWVQNTAGTITIGSSPISWTQFSGPGSYSAGVGIGLSNNVISNIGVLELTAGDNISISSATGNVTVAFDGTLPIESGGTGQTTRQAALNALVGSTPDNRVLQGNGSNVVFGTIALNSDVVSGVLPIASGGTGQTTAEGIATAILPSQTANAGKFLYTNGSSLEWVGLSIQGTGGALQFNNAGQFDGTAQISYNATDTLTVGAATDTFNIIGATGSTGLVISGGVTLGGGPVSGQNPPKAAPLSLSGGKAQFRPSAGEGDPGSPSIAGGDVIIAGGVSDNSIGGSIVFKTAQTNSLVTRLEITESGEWLVNGSAGQSNQILMSNGNGAAPTWATPTFNGTVTSIGLSGGTTGLTTTGGPITSSGTIALGGVLAVQHGGTGVTSAAEAFNVMVPSQTGNQGKFLTTNGTTASWAPAAGAGTVTSVAASGGTTGLTFTGGPINAAGTLTLGGVLGIASGGTGATTAQAALNALVGSQSIGTVLRSDGSSVSLSKVVLSSDVNGVLPIANGGTGQTTITGAINSLLPSQSGKVGKYLTTDGSVTSWADISSIVAAGGEGEIQYNSSNVTVATPAVKIISDSLILAQDASINGLTVGIGPGTGPIIQDAQGNTTTGPTYNTAFGVSALAGSVNSTYNTGIGHAALGSISNGSSSTAVGAYALGSNTDGANNVGIGYFALRANTLGSYNVALGANALRTPGIASSNTAIGSSALRLTETGSQNTSIGDSSLYKNTQGDGNVAVGYFALTNNTIADNNTAVGKNALYSSYGAGNVAVGANSLYDNTAGSNNIAIGTGAGSSLTNGDDNVIIGSHSGEAGIARTVIISAGTTQRLRFNLDGALEFAETSGYGTTGQVLVSNGSTAAPSWQPAPAADASSLTGTSLPQTITNSSLTSVGVLTSLGVSGAISATNTTLQLKTINPLAGIGEGVDGPNIVISADRDFQGGRGGSITIAAGHGGGSGSSGGHINIKSGGLLNVNGISGGDIIISTGSLTGDIERLRIASNGTWSVNGSNGTTGQVLTSSGPGSSPTWQTPTNPIPEQSGNAGKYLTTDGTATTWSSVEALPSQSGNAGKYLTTDGTTATWSSIGSSLSGIAEFGASYNEVDSTITATSTTNINCSVSNNFSISLATSISSLTFSNIPQSGRLYCATLFLEQDGTGNKTVQWPASFRWAGGTAPTLSTGANKIDIVTIVTRNAGVTWFAMVAGQAF